jgi:hypothetical protein
MSVVPDGEDQAARLEQFRTAHPDVPVLLLGLEEIFSPGARTSRTGTAP